MIVLKQKYEDLENDLKACEASRKSLRERNIQLIKENATLKQDKAIARFKKGLARNNDGTFAGFGSKVDLSKWPKGVELIYWRDDNGWHYFQQKGGLYICYHKSAAKAFRMLLNKMGVK